MGLSHSPSIVTDGLVLCLDAANRRSYPGSGTSWLDLSGNNRHAAVDNSPGFMSSGGQSYFSTSTDDLIRIDHFDYNRQKFSVEAFFRIHTAHINWKTSIFSKWQTGAASNNEFVIGASNITGPSPLIFAIQDSSSTKIESITTSWNYSTAKWYSLTGTFNSGSMKVYVNGQLENSVTSTITEVKSYSSQKFGIAVFGDTYQYITTCYVATARLYSNKELSANEVQRNYLATKSRFGL